MTEVRRVGEVNSHEWADSLLSEQQVLKVYASVGLKLSRRWSPDVVYRVFASQITLVAQRLFDTQPDSKAVARVRKRFTALEHSLSGYAEAALPRPSGGMAAVAAWLGEEEKLARTRGRRSSVFDDVTYPTILALYELTFDRRPASTEGGRAFRFVRSTLLEMQHALRSVILVDPTHQGREHRPIVVPADATLIGKLEALTGGASDVRRQHLSYCALIEAELSNARRPPPETS